MLYNHKSSELMRAKLSVSKSKVFNKMLTFALTFVGSIA